MFGALHKPWQTVLCQSLSPSDHITTSSGSHEHTDGRKNRDNKPLSKMPKRPSVNHPNNTKAKTRSVLPCGSLGKGNDDGTESVHCPPHSENPRSAVDDSPREEVELELGIVPELGLKSERISRRIYDETERGKMVMENVVVPAVSVRQAYEEVATREAAASETAKELETHKTELAKITKRKEGADEADGEEEVEDAEDAEDAKEAKEPEAAEESGEAARSEEAKEPAKPEAAEQPEQPEQSMEAKAAAHATKAGEAEKIKEKIIAQAEMAKTKEKEDKDEKDLKAKDAKKAEKTEGVEGFQDKGNEEDKAVAENRIPTSQPSELGRMEQRFPTQVSLQHNRKRSSSSQGRTAEERTPMENIPTTINRAAIDGRESPFPKSIKSIQAYGDIASFADLDQPDIRISSAPLPTSRYSGDPAAAPLPKVSTVPMLKTPEGSQLVAAAKATAKELQLRHSQPDVTKDCERKPVMPTCKQTDRENPSKTKSQGPS